MIVRTDDENYTAIAAQIRRKLGTTDAYSPSQMASAIGAIEGGVLGSKTITRNGTYLASADSLDGYSLVSVEVPLVAPHGYGTSAMQLEDVLTFGSSAR